MFFKITPGYGEIIFYHKCGLYVYLLYKCVLKMGEVETSPVDTIALRKKELQNFILFLNFLQD